MPKMHKIEIAISKPENDIAHAKIFTSKTFNNSPYKTKKISVNVRKIIAKSSFKKTS